MEWWTQRVLSEKSRKKREASEEHIPTNVRLLLKQRNKLDFRIQMRVDLLLLPCNTT